ncbi:MAG: dTDP-4-dehydrorhamnose 3,5-epimerase family protein [Patescibacteria group bacterium]
MIDGVGIYPRQMFCNEQGCVYRVMRNDDECFERFGEAYISSIKPGVVKGWNLHTRADMNIACIQGIIRLVLYDQRQDSPSRGVIEEITMGKDNYCLVHIPHGVAFSWKVLNRDEAYLMNCSTLPHDPDELLKMDIIGSDIPYQWK